MRYLSKDDNIHIVENDDGTVTEELHSFNMRVCRKCQIEFKPYSERQDIKYVALKWPTPNRAGVFTGTKVNKDKLERCFMQAVPCSVDGNDYDRQNAVCYPYNHSLHLRVYGKSGNTSMSLRPHLFLNDVCIDCGEKRTFDSAHSCLVHDAKFLNITEYIESQANMLLSCMFSGNVKAACAACKFHMQGIRELDNLENTYYRTLALAAQAKNAEKAVRGRKRSQADTDFQSLSFTETEESETNPEKN